VPGRCPSGRFHRAFGWRLGHPETVLAEFRSRGEHTSMLEDKGLRMGCALPAFPRAMGEAERVVSASESSANMTRLPGLSQEAGVARQSGFRGLAAATTCWAAECSSPRRQRTISKPAACRRKGCRAEEGGAFAREFQAVEAIVI